MSGLEKNLKNKFCNNPFDMYEPTFWGETYMCCPKWLHHPINKFDDGQTIQEGFNSEIAQKIRQSILDGTYEYCNKGLCPKIQEGSLPDKDEVTDERHRKIIDDNIVSGLKPTYYNLSYDRSCNLACPSCRKSKITISEDSGDFADRLAYRGVKEMQDRIIEEVFNGPQDHHCIISLTGSGDPFGSPMFREFLFSVDGRCHPNVFINLQTNGVMFTEKYWDKMWRIHSNINTVIISIDAGTEETYDKVRCGGSWSALMNNLESISLLRQQNLINELRLDFCIQKENYKEIPLMAQLGVSNKADKVYFSRITDWNTFWTGGRMGEGENKFKENDVFDTEHPDHDDFLEVVGSSELEHECIDLGNIAGYRHAH